MKYKINLRKCTIVGVGVTLLSFSGYKLYSMLTEEYSSAFKQKQEISSKIYSIDCIFQEWKESNVTLENFTNSKATDNINYLINQRKELQHKEDSLLCLPEVKEDEITYNKRNSAGKFIAAVFLYCCIFGIGIGYSSSGSKTKLDVGKK